MERLTRDALVERFHTYGRPPDEQLVGAEFERILLRGDGSPVGYDDEHGIRWVLQQLAERFGWTQVFEGDNVIALTRGKANTTLEPGGQVELSGAPFRSLHEVCEEALTSFGELRSLGEEADLHMVALGLTPYPAIDDIPWVPKGRYRIMRKYLPERGPLAHHMMKGTSSFQANFDYADEADCRRKVAAMSRISAVTTAMFANSPIREGKPAGWQSTRGRIWTQTDPDRTGVPDGLMDGWTHARWVDHLLAVPMMFRRTATGWVHAQGMTFGTWMTEGADGTYPDWDDWELHQTSVFPEVRVKRTLEVRGADACPLNIALAGIAMWTGILYDDVALDETLAIGAELRGSYAEQFEAACRGGMGAELAGRKAGAWAKDLVAVAGRGLSRCRPGERALLEPLEAMVAHGESPAVAVLRIFGECTSPKRCLARVLY
ncbi:MAG: glutamate--cysteine ligase [Proteobacteria bacterium]|nr:glutamate--cysteine ligase [Pseudomonadota bacterium]MCP4920140.1 glutamate--cysteine ligase [Pseudomonadota bacterium]